jgi:hypothetical protein
MRIYRVLTSVSLAFVLSSCYGGAGLQGTLQPSTSTAAAPDGTASLLPTTTETHNCPQQHHLAAVSLSKGTAFWVAFPAALDAPELRDVAVPLIAIVYDGAFPAPLTGVPGAARPTLAPGEWDICVETADGSEGIAGQAMIVYGSVSSAQSIVK